MLLQFTFGLTTVIIPFFQIAYIKKVEKFLHAYFDFSKLIIY